MSAPLRDPPPLPRFPEPIAAPGIAPAPGDAWLRLAAYAARLLDAPLGRVSRVDGEPPHAWIADGAGAGWEPRAAAPLAQTLCRHTVARGRALLVGDARTHPLIHDDPASWMGELAYAGVPLRDGGGQVRGALAVVDGRARDWTPDDARVLDDLAELARALLDRDDASPAVTRAPPRRRLSLRMLEKAVETMQLGVTITDPDGRILYSNPADARMHGYTQAELRGRHARVFAPVEHARELTPRALDGVASWSRETVNVRADGTPFPVLLRSDVVRDGQGRVLGLVTCCEDLTRRRELERQLVQNAFYDPVTGLANAGLLNHRLELEVHRARRGEAGFAVLAVGLHRFKVVNDSLGRDAGDRVLRAAGDRIRGALPGEGLVARVSGDEFVVLVDDAPAVGAATRVAVAVLDALARPFALGDQEVTLGASVGIALSASGYARADDVLRDASIALYRAKGRRDAGYEVFDQAMHALAVERLALETELRRALARDELVVHYQPVVSLDDGRMTGVEALVRWNHPARGTVMPGQFVPLAEETGLILPLGMWVMERACRDLAAWNAARPDRPLTLAVNLSPQQLAQAGLADEVARVLRETGTPPELLRLEITETVLMDHHGGHERVLHALKATGVRLYIDDFGTGYSSLSYLHRLPLDGLKVDRSFVDASARADGLHLVRAIVAMGRALGVEVVAEGVEVPEVVDELRDLGCGFGQGFHFGAAMDADALATLAADDPSR